MDKKPTNRVYREASFVDKKSTLNLKNHLLEIFGTALPINESQSKIKYRINDSSKNNCGFFFHKGRFTIYPGFLINFCWSRIKMMTSRDQTKWGIDSATPVVSDNHNVKNFRRFMTSSEIKMWLWIFCP